MGCYAYTSDNIADVSRQAMQSGAEYVICIPSEIEEMKPMLEAHKAQSLNGRSVPRMLFRIPPTVRMYSRFTVMPPKA